MIIARSLVFLCLAFAVAGNAVAAESDTRQPGERIVQSAAYNEGDATPFLGDQPGDVAKVNSTTFAGLPLALADGRVMLWATGDVGGKRVARAVFSKDNGATWSEVVTLFEFPVREEAQWSGGASLVDYKGYIHLFGLEYYQFDFKVRSKSKSHLWHARSRDGGRNWDAVQDVPFGYEYTGSSNNALQTRRGRIFAPVSALSNRKVGAWVSVCPYSDDNGGTWRLPEQEVAINTGAADWYESGAAEPVGIELKDGRLWLLPRSQDGFQWESFSRDHGRTWSPPRHTRFISNQSAMAILRLKDGQLLLLWNNCGAEGFKPIGWGNAERAVLAAAISGDEGETWRGYREVARVTSNASVGYPYATQMRDGRVLVNASGFIAGIDPSFLAATNLSEDFTQGIRRWSTLASEGVSAVASLDGGPGRLLRMIKPKVDVPSAACLNFPFGRNGTITLALRIERNFQGAHLTLSDHYDLPGLPRDGSFPVRITNKGRVELNGSGGSWLATPGDLIPGKWHQLTVAWDCTRHQALLELDGIEIGRLHQYVSADGVCYLRIRSTATATDEAEMYIKSVKVAVPSR